MKKISSKRLYNIYGYTGGNFGENVYEKNAISPTIINYSDGVISRTVRSGGRGSTDRHAWDIVRVDGGEANTLQCNDSNGVVTKNNGSMRIRKLTPRECWRLMGFSDEDFDKAQKINSNTQLYKQAGNSIVVNVLEAIFREMLPKDEVQ